MKLIPVQLEERQLKLVARLRVKLTLTEGVNDGLAVNEGLAVGKAMVPPAVGREIVGPGAVGLLTAGGLGRTVGLLGRAGGLGRAVGGDLFPPPPRSALTTPT